MKLKTKLSKLRHDGHITDAEYSIIINVLNKFSTQPPKAQPCEDCISREEVKNEIRRWIGYLDEDMIFRINVGIDRLPSVTPWLVWIPVSERLPEEAYGCIVTVMDTNPMTLEEFENIYPDFVGWDGENWNDADGDSIPFEVIAWMPRPQPYEVESEVTE